MVAATRGQDRGRVRQAEVDDAFAQDLDDLIRLQREASLDYHSDGLLRWPDLFRPLVDACPALEAHTLIRWFDNNAFFRAPERKGALTPIQAPEAIVPDARVPRPRVATIPSPFLFSRAAIGIADRNAFMLELTRAVLGPAVARLSRAGCELIHLEEPWLAYFGIDASDWKPLAESLEILRAATTGRLVFSLSFGDAGPHVARLRDLPIDALGVDLVETDVAELGTDWPMGLAAGCLNARSSLLESLEDTVDLIHHLARTVRPAALYICASSSLELLPATVAQHKIRLLGEAARRAREAVAA